MTGILRNLTFWIFFAMLAGIVVGYSFPEVAIHLKVLNDVFLRMIKMIIAPLVFTTLVLGVCKMGDFKAVGRIGVKTLIYFQFATLLALSLGLVLVNLLKPGKILQIPVPAQGTESGVAAKTFELSSFLLHLIPTSIFKALAENDILPIVIFSVLFGTALAAIGEQASPVIKVFESLSKAIFKMTNYVMYLAPLGVFGALAMVVGEHGLKIFVGYAYLIGSFYLGLFFFVFVILGVICFVLRIQLFELIKKLKDAILLAFSTASSEAAYPKVIQGLEEFGCSNRVTGFVIPLGYSFNLDGSIMYMTFATLFIAQVYNIDMSVSDQITMMLILLFTSKGMAGVPRASMVVITAMLQHFSIPTEGILLLLGIDQLLDMGRSAVNVVGNGVATCVVAKWEGEFSQKSNT